MLKKKFLNLRIYVVSIELYQKFGHMRLVPHKLYQPLVDFGLVIDHAPAVALYHGSFVEFAVELVSLLNPIFRQTDYDVLFTSL